MALFELFEDYVMVDLHVMDGRHHLLTVDRALEVAHRRRELLSHVSAVIKVDGVSFHLSLF